MFNTVCGFQTKEPPRMGKVMKVGTIEVIIRDETCRALTGGDPSGAEASPHRSFPTLLGATTGREPS